MPRSPKPRYWKARECWFVTINGTRHNLGPDKVDAQDRFHQLMLARRETTVQEGSLTEMLDRFYLYRAEDKKPSTAAWYKKYLEDFLSYLESKVSSQPLAAAAWMDGAREGSSNRRLRRSRK